MENVGWREKLTAATTLFAISLGATACSNSGDKPAFCDINESIYKGTMVNAPSSNSAYNIFRVGNGVRPDGLSMSRGDQNLTVQFQDLIEPVSFEIGDVSGIVSVEGDSTELILSEDDGEVVTVTIPGNRIKVKCND